MIALLPSILRPPDGDRRVKTRECVSIPNIGKSNRIGVRIEVVYDTNI